MKYALWVLLASCAFTLAAAPARAVDAAERDCAQHEDKDAAIQGCSKVIQRGAAESARNRVIAYTNRGVAYYHKGDLDSALADYNEAIRLDPNYERAYDDRGNVYRRKGDLDRALADYNEAIHLDPKYAAAYDNRGSLYFERGDLERALVDVNQAIRLNPTFAFAYSNRAEVRARKGDFDGVIADCDVSQRLDPKRASCHAYRAYALAKKGKFANASAEIGEAFKLDPKNPNAFAYRGELELLTGAPQSALQDFEAALAERPYNSFAQAGRDAAKRALEALQSEAHPAPAASPTVAPPPASPAVVASSAPLGIRVALVVGNAHYTAQPPLKNPPNDTAAVAAALRAAGFAKVVVADDLSRDGIVKALHDFEDDADRSDWAVIYFSGHGVEVGGQNYVVPVDAHIKSDRDIADEAVSLDRLMASVSGAHKLKIVILDACRENPFAAAMRRTVSMKSAARGLAPVEPLRATLVVYAAKDGEFAMDGDGANSPFAAALVKHLAEPHVEIGKMFRLVTADVLGATDQKQQPFVYGSLGPEDYYFRP